ncbi:hypothetical protein ZHAS_00007916 [Anopheles sinensis]|uniref:G_PROTEIN_RECEP_F1_2 domain-containing protein n=1 Tax=Anopheles sinensis TaxID=74873 RepID=A0A084VR16_ANOSI|nr:hypothetical protein ZHAS_00007916 [Anopheles sinensis]
MDLKAGKHLVAPAINNISCSNNRFAGNFFSQIGPFDVIQALFIVLLTFLVISANLMVILVINSRRYALYIQPQPRYLLTSLALNDLAIGLLIIPFSALPALLHCWPYGEIFCQIQVRPASCLYDESPAGSNCVRSLHRYRRYYEELYHNKVLLYSCAWLSTDIYACSILGYIISDPVKRDCPVGQTFRQPDILRRQAEGINFHRETTVGSFSSRRSNQFFTLGSPISLGDFIGGLPIFPVSSASGAGKRSHRQK